MIKKSIIVIMLGVLMSPMAVAQTSVIENYSYYSGYTWNRIDLLSAGYYKKIGLAPGEKLALLKEYFDCGTSCLSRGYYTYSNSVTTALMAKRNEYNAGLQIMEQGYMPVIRVVETEPVCEFYN